MDVGDHDYVPEYVPGRWGWALLAAVCLAGQVSLAATPAPSPTASPVPVVSLVPALPALPAPSPAASSTPDAAAARLAEVQRRLQEIDQQLSVAKEKEADLLARIVEIDRQIVDRASDIDTLQEQVNQARARSEEYKASMEKIHEGIGRKKAWLASRVRLAFIHGRPGYLKVLFSAESYPDLVQKTRFQSIIARRDGMMVGELKSDLKTVAANRADYDDELAELDRQQKQEKEKTEELAMDREVRQGLLDRAHGDRESVEKMLAVLTADANKMASEVGDMQGGSTEAVAPRAKIAFVDLKGHLHPPVTAPLMRGWGPYKVPPGLTMINQGVNYAAPAGTQVRVVADGRVVKAGWFGSYGQLLVVDHGDGWHTLYCHNGKLLKAQNEDVRQGDLIALTGDTGSLEGPELYFAIFRQGKPVDPGEWLLKSGTAGVMPTPVPAPTPTAAP